MAKSIFFQSSFSGGEVSPKLMGQVNSDQFKASVKTATNVYIQKHGPLCRRPGTTFIKEVKTSSSLVKLIKFRISSTVSYMLEFGNTYIRVFRDRANVTSGGSPYEITTPYSAAEVQNIQVTPIGSSLYISHPSYNPRVLTRSGDASWTLSSINFYPSPVKELGYKPAATLTPAATSGTGINFTAGSSVPFQAGDVGRQLTNLGGTGKAVIVSITSGTVVVCDIIEAFPSTSAIASQSWQISGSPIGELNVTAGPVGKIGERMTITIEDTASTASIAGFRSADVGNYLRFNGGLVKIITYTSSSVVNAVVVSALNNVTKTTSFTMESELWSSTNGYPGSIGQYQQRLVLGGTTTYPQTIWLSATGVYDNFAGGATDSSSLEFTPVSDDTNLIQWIKPSDKLIIGTAGAEFSLAAADGASGALTPSSATSKVTSNYGSATQSSAISIGSNVIFKQSEGKTLRSYAYDLNKDKYIGGDMTFWAEHIAEEGIKEIAYAQFPNSLIFVVLDSGDMMVGTYLPDLSEPVLGWTRYTTDGSFENVATLVTDTGTEVWVVVNRTINGTTKRYIELFDTEDGTNNIDSFSDSSLTYSLPLAISGITKANPAVVTSTAHGLSNGNTVKIRDVEGMTEVNNRTFTVANVTANTFELSGENSSSYTTYTTGGNAYKQVTTITGLSHLEAKEVAVRADGAVHPLVTVSSGSITLDYPVSEVCVGIPMESEITTLPPNFGSNMGQMSGQPVRWSKPHVRLLNSGLPLLNDSFIPSRSAQDAMDSPPALFTGDASYEYIGWGTGELSFTYSDPLPLNIQAIFGSIDFGVT